MSLENKGRVFEKQSFKTNRLDIYLKESSYKVYIKYTNT